MHSRREQDQYWQQDTPLFSGMFRYYREKPRPVRAKIHTSDEPYELFANEIIAIPTRRGRRTYLHLTPYVFEPNITLTVGLYPAAKHYADQDSSIGEVKGAKQEGVREVIIGNAQAWYYPEDRILVLWECFLQNFVRDLPLLKDPNMARLWESVEQQLLKQFPHAQKIATPFSDPLFPTQDYQRFLASQGYKATEEAAFSKQVR